MEKRISETVWHVIQRADLRYSGEDGPYLLGRMTLADRRALAEYRGLNAEQRERVFMAWEAAISEGDESS